MSGSRKNWNSLDGAARRRIRRKVCQRHGWKCFYCGRNFLASIDEFMLLTMDHVKTRSDGGEESSPDNMVPACSVCNQLRGSAPFKSYRDTKQIISDKKLERVGDYLLAMRLDRRRRWWRLRRRCSLALITEYKGKKLPTLSVTYRDAILGCLKHFTRIVKPKYVSKISARTIDGYIAERRQETTERIGKKIGPRDGKAYEGNPKRTSNRAKKAAAHNLVTPATINRELRHIKVVLGVAKDWGYLARVPKIKMLKTLKKRPRWVTVEDFAKIYVTCKTATRPESPDGEYSAEEWWQALLSFLYLTGWRISETLEPAWDQVSLDGATATTLAETNKAGRDEELPLHPAVVDHLRTIISFGNPGNRVFWWPHHDRILWSDFAKIQKAAGIHLECTKRHEHKPSCHRYGFHDFRRAFATLNAKKLGGTPCKN